MTDRACLHHVVAQLQLMAAEKYAEARAHAFGFSSGDRLTLSHRRARLCRYAADAQRDAAALSKLARQAAGVEEMEP